MNRGFCHGECYINFSCHRWISRHMPRWWKASCQRPVVVKRLEAPHDRVVVLLTIRVYTIASCIYNIKFVLHCNQYFSIKICCMKFSCLVNLRGFHFLNRAVYKRKCFYRCYQGVRHDSESCQWL